MTLRVYIAGASDDLERVDQAARLIHAPDTIAVVSTWPASVRKAGAGNPRDASRWERLDWINDDLNDLDRADLFWFLAPTRSPARGAYFELGYMVGRARAVPLISSGDTLQSIFNAITREFASDEAAALHILLYAAKADR